MEVVNGLMFFFRILSLHFHRASPLQSSTRRMRGVLCACLPAGGVKRGLGGHRGFKGRRREVQSPPESRKTDEENNAQISPRCVDIIKRGCKIP